MTPTEVMRQLNSLPQTTPIPQRIKAYEAAINLLFDFTQPRHYRGKYESKATKRPRRKPESLFCQACSGEKLDLTEIKICDECFNKIRAKRPWETGIY